MKHKFQHIKSCKNCSFTFVDVNVNSYKTYLCGYDEKILFDIHCDWEKIPKECPLREGPVTIAIDGNYKDPKSFLDDVKEIAKKYKQIPKINRNLKGF